MAIGNRREHRGDRHRIGVTDERIEEPSGSVEVERGYLAAVQLDPAVNDRCTGDDRVAQVGGPGRQRRHRACGRAADPQHRDSPQITPLDDRVHRVRGAEHRVRDPRSLIAQFCDHELDRGRDPAGDIDTRRRLSLDQDPVVAVDNDRVGVGRADVDPEPEIERGDHRFASLTARDPFAGTGTKGKSYPNAVGPAASRPASVRQISSQANAITLTRRP